MLLKTRFNLFIAIIVAVGFCVFTGNVYESFGQQKLTKKEILEMPVYDLSKLLQLNRMEYSTEKGKVSKYSLTFASSSQIDIMGQIVFTSESLSSEMVHKIAGISGDVISHELSFSKLSLITDSEMTGRISMNTSATIGKVLKVTTGKHGENQKILNLKEFPAIEGSVVPFALSLLEILPDLAEKTVRLKDTWHASHKRKIDSSEGTFNVSEEVDYTFAVIEEKMGFDCMKIETKSTSKITGSGYAQDQEVQISGSETSTGAFYFAYKEGIIIESEEKLTLKMEISVADMVDVMPLWQSGSMTIKYIK